MKKDYLAYSIEDFYNLGIIDAITEGKSDENKIEQVLSPIIPKKGIEERIRKYKIGYRAGLIRVLFFTPLGEDIYLPEKNTLTLNKGE